MDEDVKSWRCGVQELCHGDLKDKLFAWAGGDGEDIAAEPLPEEAVRLNVVAQICDAVTPETQHTARLCTVHRALHAHTHTHTACSTSEDTQCLCPCHASYSPCTGS